MVTVDAAEAASLAPSWFGSLGTWLPRGGALDPTSWAGRHRGICLLLWLHVLALPVIAVTRGAAPLHSVADAALIAGLAALATLGWLESRYRAAAATMGLLVSSAAVVHVFDGVIEAHFHFFVMVAVVALYQAWFPFLLALSFVIVHHGVIGTMLPEAVYNHPAAIEQPWLWGLIHGGFVLAESVACLVYWRASEQSVDRERQVRLAAERTREELAHAQQLSQMGSWEWDVVSDTVTWSAQLYAMAGQDAATFRPSVGTFLEMVPPAERDEVAELVIRSLRAGHHLDFECPLVRADGEVITVHALGDAMMDAAGRVVHMRGSIQDVTERRRLQETITEMAFQDPLTGLANRRLLLDRLDEAVARCDAGEGACALLFIDLDGFKAVNDRHGHAVGDALLREVAGRLRAAVRASDTVSRFGGDEFALLCPGGDHDLAALTAERIEQELCRPIMVDGAPVVVAASIGIAVAEPGTTADTLLRSADAAMYDVKARTRVAQT